MNAYDAGDVIRLTGTFTNSAAAAVDPSSLTLQYVPPTNVTTTVVYGVDAALVKSATGQFYADIAVNSSGVWSYRWNGSGSNAAAVEGMFQVRVRNVV